MTRGLWLGTWGARARGEEFRENGFGVSVNGERVKRYNCTELTIVQFDGEVRFNLSGQLSAAESGGLSLLFPLASLGLSSLPQCGYLWSQGAFRLQVGV